MISGAGLMLSSKKGFEWKKIFEKALGKNISIILFMLYPTLFC